MIMKPEEKKDPTKVNVVKKGNKCLKLGHIAFQCPNKKVMIVHESVEEVVSENELDPEEEVEKVQVIPLEEGELLVIHSNLSIQSKKEEE